MMTDEQYAWLRSILGARTPSEGDVEDALDSLGTIRAVALQYLRTWRAELIAAPTSVNVPGAVGVGWSGNIAALDRVIKQVEEGPDDPSLPGPVVDDVPPPVGVVFARSAFQRPAPSPLARRRWR